MYRVHAGRVEALALSLVSCHNISFPPCLIFSPLSSSHNLFLCSVKLFLEPVSTRKPFPSSLLLQCRDREKLIFSGALLGQGKFSSPALRPGQLVGWLECDREPSAPGFRAVPLAHPGCCFNISIHEESLLNLFLFKKREKSRKSGREGRQTHLHLGNVMFGFSTQNGQ